ncbi:LamG-like jellyroll fold domain-containing protein [Nonomuraea aridisoli]|uniref:LamG-like jellyroll fold domain-containing protein n=1 Tax=Nonomuraea aridisoli TaxID=2070368 RepID=UPI0034DD7AB1
MRWSDKDGDYTVLEQKGAHQTPFKLGNTAEHGLVFTFTGADATNATVEGVLSGVEPPVDAWFHLAGVYDAATRTATLYLNGVQAGTAQLSFPSWNVQAPLWIGAAMAGSLPRVRLQLVPSVTTASTCKHARSAEAKPGMASMMRVSASCRTTPAGPPTCK